MSNSMTEYKSNSTETTLQRQALIRRFLRHEPNGLTVTEIADDLGLTSSLTLYHLKKMAATYQLVLVPELYKGPGGLRYRAWNPARLREASAGLRGRLTRAA